ncbi:hypothetical protein UFOVP407_31 [uncultured Caudovirales phage]|uniref:Uncharacterized protein n=1 Tax=uncultured Caudovirales phage TaxID=2100421 RepID=A0A6J5M8M9_9CAUD|nr:hypothetical protein UFOVP407_31 [uncultured Caudovirales phage]
MTGGLQQFARVLEDVERTIHTDALRRYHNDPAYRAEVEASRTATREQVQATMRAAVERFHGRNGQ